MTDIPKAIWEGSFKLGNQEIRCYVLDNGMRIMNAEDINDFFSSETINGDISEDQLLEFAKWSKGVKP